MGGKQGCGACLKEKLFRLHNIEQQKDGPNSHTSEKTVHT